MTQGRAGIVEANAFNMSQATSMSPLFGILYTSLHAGFLAEEHRGFLYGPVSGHNDYYAVLNDPLRGVWRDW